VPPAIRPYTPQDLESVIALALRAWTPVFASLQAELGRELFVRLHGDWRNYQAAAVRDVLAAEGVRTWVAEAADRVVGFVAATVDGERKIGEIEILAVDPGDQGSGIGSALTAVATDWLRDSGMQVAMVETGADPGHAAARRVYEKADYTLLGVARYFKPL
jgi:ribosomal protein S18 acetylase RimI-like enzyme